jgi:cell division septum initiation protein DivIVA
MQLEKLDLLEKRLSRFIEQYAQLKEEKEFLSKRLKTQAERLEELEAEVAAHSGQREKAGEVIGRITGVLDKLELLQASEAGAQ